MYPMKIIAHRGDASKFPENTIEAFEAAQIAGANGVELDVHFTKDKKLVVYHDYHLGNPDNGKGIISQVTLEYINSLSIQNSCHIPTLEEVFFKFGKTLHYELEIKAFSFDALQEIIELVQRYQLEDKIEFTSSHPYILSHLKQQYPSLITGYFSAPKPDWMDITLYRTLCIAEATTGGLDVLHYPAHLIDTSIVNQAHDAGLLVHSANCDQIEDFSKAIKSGVDQLSTNQLSRALSSLRKQLG